MQTHSPIGWAVRPFKKYAVFSGRAPRAEFWWFFLFVMILYFGVIMLLGVAGAAIMPLNGGNAITSGPAELIVIFVGLFWLALFIPTLAVQVRRLHDTNRSGWWLGAFWLLYAAYFVLIFGMGFAADPAGSAVGPYAALAVGIVAIAFFVYSVVLLVFSCIRGTEGTNRFGPDPYGEDVAEIFA